MDKNIIDLFEFLSQIGDTTPTVSIDFVHNMFLVGAILAKKPERVLEVGIGSGYVTRSIIDSLRYNRKGKLTCVDNWYDWRYKEPKEIDNLRNVDCAEVIVSDEYDFLHRCPPDKYDIIVSDGDHNRSGLWVDHYLRVTKHNGFMFFHDVNNTKDYPNMKHIIENTIHLPHYLFAQSSREHEDCEDGWLFVINKKE